MEGIHSGFNPALFDVLCEVNLVIYYTLPTSLLMSSPTRRAARLISSDKALRMASTSADVVSSL